MSVERGSGLVEEQDTGILQDGSRDGNLEKERRVSLHNS